MTDPTIAVVIPVHNKERHVVRSLEAGRRAGTDIAAINRTSISRPMKSMSTRVYRFHINVMRTSLRP